MLLVMHYRYCWRVCSERFSSSLRHELGEILPRAFTLVLQSDHRGDEEHARAVRPKVDILARTLS